MAVVPRISGTVRYEVYEGNRLDPAISDSWGSEGTHWHVFDWGYVNQYLQKGLTSNCKYLELHVSVPSPFDNLMNENLLRAIAGSWDSICQEGAPVRATMWYKGTHHILGIPTLWQYVIFLEYHESPLIQIAVIVELLAMVFAVVIGMKMLGFDAGSVNKLVAAPFTGTTYVFIIGIGFLVALAYFQDRMKMKAPVRVTAPKLPQVAPTYGPVGTVSRAATGRRR